MNTELINRILDRFEDKFVGVNPLAIDRLHKGTKAEVTFYKQLVRKYKHDQETIRIATHSMIVMDAEIKELRESVKASGLLSMGMGAKRDPVKDQE